MKINILFSLEILNYVDKGPTFGSISLLKEGSKSNVFQNVLKPSTETGIKLFHRQLKLVETLESKIRIKHNGIEENLDSKTLNFYNTSVESYSCSF